MVVMRLLERLILVPKTVASLEEMRKIKVSKSMHQHVVVFKFLGYWPPRKGSKYYYPYLVYCGNQVFWVALMWNVTQIINFFLVADDLEQAAASSYILTCTVCEVIKAYYFLKNVYKTGDVVKSLDREIFKPRNLAEYELVADILRLSQLSYVVYKTCATITVIFWAIYPISDASTLRRLPFPAWFPWDHTRTPAYELCYVYQVVSVFFMAWLNITMDTTASILMANIFAQLDLLSHKLRHLFEDTEFSLKEKGAAEVTPEVVREAMVDGLEECVEHHKNILELADKIGRVFTVSVFYQIIISGAILCMTMFQLTLVSVFSFEFFSLTFFQICMFLEVAMYCWFGNEIIIRSGMLVDSAFCTDWIECSPKFKQNLLFFMTRCARPMRMYAGGFFILSVETWTLILRSAWSYFAVLRQAHNRK